MFRSIVLLSVGFVIGLFVRQLMLGQRVQMPVLPTVQLVPEKTSEVKDKLVTTVTYKNNTFTPQAVTVKHGNYLSITNMSDSLMWLESDYDRFATPRGYGTSEQLKVKPDRVGTFSVSNKLNLNVAPLKVTVE